MEAGMEGEEDILSYLNLDPDHHQKIAALIPKVKKQVLVQCWAHYSHNTRD